MEINQIISLSNHCLYLCNNSNIEEVVFASLIDADVFITNNIEKWQKKFDDNKIKCPINLPNKIKQNECMVIDGSSLGKDFERLERKFEKCNKAICIYNIDELELVRLKQLVALHDKMLLYTNNIKMFSDKNLEKEIDGLNPEFIENLVKRDLKNILLSLLLSKPMCGTDLVKILYKKFKVFISPGMLYPALHELEKIGLLKYECNLKSKIYSVQKKEEVKSLLEKCIKVNSFVSRSLVDA